MIRKNLLSILVAIAIFWLSMSDSDDFDRVKLFDIPHNDKIVHMGMYFILMTAILYENRKKIVNNRLILTAAIFPLLYGIIIELLQSFTASRSSSFYDVLADAAGIIISIILWTITRAYWRKY